MHMSQEEIKAEVLAAYPASFRRRLAQGVFSAYRTEWERCDANFAPTERASVFWFARRARIEENARDSAELVDGVEAVTQPIPQSGWNYTTIRGGSCNMVLKKVEKPGVMIEHAEYRTALAQENPQQSLFLAVGSTEPGPKPDDHGLLVVANYSSYIPAIGDTERYPYLPGSLHLACPDDNLKTYLWEWNIFEEFPDVVRGNVPNTWDDDGVLRFLRHSKSATYRFGGGA